MICRLSTCRVTATNRKKTEISTSKLVLSGQGRRCSEGNTCPDRKRGKRCPDSVCDCIGQEHFCRENSAEKRERIRIAKERDLNDKNRLVAQTLPRNLKRLFLFSLEISLSPAPFRHLSYRRATTVFNFGLKSSSKLPEIFLKKFSIPKRQSTSTRATWQPGQISLVTLTSDKGQSRRDEARFNRECPGRANRFDTSVAFCRFISRKAHQ